VMGVLPGVAKCSPERCGGRGKSLPPAPLAVAMFGATVGGDATDWLRGVRGGTEGEGDREDEP
jgi:hypothetical protein